MSSKLIQILCGLFVHSLDGFLASGLMPWYDISISKTTVNSALHKLRSLKHTPAPQTKWRAQQTQFLLLLLVLFLNMTAVSGFFECHVFLINFGFVLKTNKISNTLSCCNTTKDFL